MPLVRTLLVASLLAVPGCAPKPPDGSEYLVSVGDPLLIDATRGAVIPGSDAFPFVELSSAAFLDDARLVVADPGVPALYLVEVDAARVRRIGREGAGPGEYRRPEVIGRSGGDVIASDMALFRLLRVDTSGALAIVSGAVEKPDNGILNPRGIFAESLLVSTLAHLPPPSRPGTLDSVSASVYTQRLDGAGRVELGEFPYATFINQDLGGTPIRGPRYMDWRLHVRAGREVLAVGAGNTPVLELFSPGSTQGTRFRLPLERRTFSADEREAYRQDLVERCAVGPAIAPERFADSVAAFRDLLVDDAGRVWVVGPHWGDRSPDWIARLDPSARRLQFARLPAGFFPLAIGMHHIAGRQLAADGAVAIAVYPF